LTISERTPESEDAEGEEARTEASARFVLESDAELLDDLLFPSNRESEALSCDEFEALESQLSVLLLFFSFTNPSVEVDESLVETCVSKLLFLPA